MARDLAARGVPSPVVALSRIPHFPGDRVKIDRCGELASARVPDRGEEAARDLVRAREDACRDLMRARHPLSKLLLRRGILWEERTWTAARELWLSRQQFAERSLRVAYEEAFAAMGSITRTPPG